METEEFLRNAMDPVLIGFYHVCVPNPTEEIEVNTNNFDTKIKYIKEKYPNSIIDGFWCDEGQIIAHATYGTMI